MPLQTLSLALWSKTSTTCLLIQLKHFVLSLNFNNTTLDPNSLVEIQNIIMDLAQHFSIKYLHHLLFFLVIKAINTQGLFLSQHSYILDILKRFQIDGTKETTTPISSTTTLQLHDGAPTTNAKTYRSLIDNLQYLSLARSNIIYTKNKL